MSQRFSPLGELAAFIKDIRLEHSLFALPFALLGMLLAGAWRQEHGLADSPWPEVYELACILLAMIGTRTAAMGFNRLVDRQLDARNPRTAGRPLAAGRAGRGTYLGFILIGIGALIFAAAQLNALAVALVPVVLVVTLGYSFTKRFTILCHWFVGLALGIAPLGAWVALCGTVPQGAAPWALALAVMTWVGGFDILYATLDLRFDREAGVRSVPARFGVPTALAVARGSHLAMLAALAVCAVTGPGLGAGFAAAVAVSAGLLVWQHVLVRPDDLRRVNTAFFTLNAVVGFVLLAGGLADAVT